MTDQEHANRIDGLKKQLNQAIYEAAISGLTIKVNVLELNRIQQADPVPSVDFWVTRRIEPERGQHD